MSAKVYGIDVFISTNIEIKKQSILFINEFWKDIKGYEGLYKVSSLGRVYSYKRTDVIGRPKGGLYKSTLIGRSKNYRTVTLNKNGVKKSRDLHRLVMETFLPEYKSQCVNHKNGNKLHNHISNLEWTTQSKNLLHAYRTGLHKGATGTIKMDWDKAAEVRRLSKKISRKELAKIYGCSLSCIREIIVGITWKTK